MQTVPTPAVEFRIPDFVPSQHIHDFVARLMSEAAKMGVEPGDLRRLIVATDETYGPAIRELDPSADYTNDGVYLGVGKILAEVVDGAFVGSNLVVHHSLFGCFAAEPNPERPPGELEAFRYTFFHEMGHCIDHRRRPAQHAPAVPLATKSHLMRCAALNSTTVFEEYAACFFSAGYMSPAGFGYMANSMEENLAAYLGKCAAQRTQYQFRLGTLMAVNDAALNAFWRGLIEFAKLIALLHGNPALGSALPGWPDGSEESAFVLQRFARDLVAAWGRYPDCLPEFEQVTTDAWFGLTAAEGYIFEARPEGDYLRFA